MAKLTTTYNELKELGACQDGLDKLWGWIANKMPQPQTGYEDNARAYPLTPADILESNGREHLIWAVDHVRAWGKAYASWLDTLPIGADRGVEAWAKAVSAPKPLAKDLKAGDRVFLKGIGERGVYEVFTSGLILFNTFAGLPHCERMYPETLDAIGFTLIEPKREPRKLKAEQILVPENVGTKWRSLQSKMRHVYLVEEDMGGGEPGQFLVHTVNGDPVHLTSNTFADTWEEVIE